MLNPLNIIIVEKTGILKSLSIKDYKEEELYKKFWFKNINNFIKQTEWDIIENKIKYKILVYGKTDGRANNENKYDFPPPIDNILFFGNCAIIAKIKNKNKTENLINLSLELWKKIYSKLFGGFEDLALCAIEDEYEEDELDNIPKHKKTKKGGYLKDGFVVDSSDTESEEFYTSENDDDDEDNDDGDDNNNNINENNIIKNNEETIGSELSEESYDYSSEEDKKK